MNLPRTVLVLAVAALATACTSPIPTPARRPAVSTPVLDWNRLPGLTYRIDSFIIPEASRAPFTERMRQNMAYIRTLPGFRGHVVFEKRAGEAAYNLVTLAAWESPEAIERAGREVRAYYQRIGFDMPGALKGWGIQMVRADYDTPAELQ